VKADDHPVSPLAALIERVIADERARGDTKFNQSDIARRSDGEVTRGNVNRYLRKPMGDPPPLEKRRGLALGLRVHPVVVDRAVAESLELMVEPQFQYDYRTDPQLGPVERQRIDVFIEGVRRSSRRRRSG